VGEAEVDVVEGENRLVCDGMGAKTFWFTRKEIDFMSFRTRCTKSGVKS
jgi:hypothetical protein